MTQAPEQDIAIANEKRKDIAVKRIGGILNKLRLTSDERRQLEHYVFELASMVNY